ncbi:MAG TPA: SDR family NAD(P)-dependent oxidoreductase, partial [Streptosporangiaceae bacterium]|nr:SDR family NAD(P)-dependent oxidoreductase [Streptosporangiaceae bacterium]
LGRCAQAEHPGRITLADTDGQEASTHVLPAVLAAAVAVGEPQVAVRGGTGYVPRLVRAGSGRNGLLAFPDAPGWRLDLDHRGTFDGVVLTADNSDEAPLSPGQVKVAVRAAGVNFRDVAVALDIVSDTRALGGEAAGVVTEVAPDVTGLAAGDRVTGLFPGLCSVAVTDARLLMPIPEGWSFAQAATVPAAFVTAWYGLADLGRLAPGDKLLLHAAAGGVGMAALQLARRAGAQVYATASPPKWDTLRALGLPDTRIASSRTPAFEAAFLAATGGQGVDAVLNCLTGELTDASLRLLPRGGKFIEMGKTDIRDPAAVAAAHPGVTYRAFDTADAGPDRIAEILAALHGLFTAGQLTPLPVTAFDIRRAPAALRHLAQARHTGKIILTIPPDLTRALATATVLITGGTGTLGAHTARHLAAAHGARHLLLASRHGPAAPGAQALREELAALGARATITACDTADRGALAALLASIPAEHPLGAVIHAAGVLDDGVLTSLTPARLAPVLAAKADAAWHLHELTAGMDLSAFILYSSAAGTLGSPGQASYAAANTFLDALATRRHAAAQPAHSLAWGLWEQPTGLTSHLTPTDHTRITRHGITALTTSHGLALLDTTLATGHPVTIPARINTTTQPPDQLPPLLRALAPARRAAAPAIAAAGDQASALARRLAARPEADQPAHVLDLVRSNVATVLGHATPEAIDPAQPFRDLGFDSLTAIELRNRLNTATGLHLPATLTFDYPTPDALARWLHAQILPA